ncbi:hypothetical protein SAMN04489740_0814 [Arthrobacter alpinus]|uniref:Uncharacterized protein n=1 Tax=Arthrobacter alpinus TaxID=656366 RepID=A0A0U3P8F3_9MICC|nr:hypothetical protein [Arthrobacter alpinus]ALV45471.1 hypothetical protein MB46_08180 [Arthrobacter alpinus]SEE17434.1 hypothetical protein SAMN04489740_0814 [Arthrobacter alpinus]
MTEQELLRPAGVPEEGTRNESRALWRRGLSSAAIVGACAGVLWWLAAPGGAFYGQGTDATTWLPRDAVLGTLLLVAGIVSGVLTMRRRRVRVKTGGGPLRSLSVLVLALSGVAGSIIAWRVGVFAGDLFQTPPDNMPNPSIVFSLRSGPVLLVWPLVSSLVVFIWSLVSFAYVPSTDETLHTTAGANG